MAAELEEARARVVRLENELRAALGGGRRVGSPAGRPARGTPRAGVARKRGRVVGELRGKVVELARQGVRSSAIAAKLGVTPAVVSGHLYRAGLAGELDGEKKPPPAPVAVVERSFEDRVVALARDGLGTEAIVKRLGAERKAVAVALLQAKRNGVPPGPKAEAAP